MELKILEQNKDRLKIEIVGEGHTLSNALRKELWENQNVRVAGYNIEYSLVSNPVMIIETIGSETPKKAVFTALENIRKRNKEILTELNKVLK